MHGLALLNFLLYAWPSLIEFSIRNLWPSLIEFFN